MRFSGIFIVTIEIISFLMKFLWFDALITLGHLSGSDLVVILMILGTAFSRKEVSTGV